MTLRIPFLALALGAAVALEAQSLSWTALEGRPSAEGPTPTARTTTGEGPFRHGVASGDPLTDGVILWTRVTTPEPSPEPVPVSWSVALDPAFTLVVAEGQTVTGPERDFTVKVDVRGLAPNTTYWYQFRALNRRSLIGRTRTAPDGPLDRLRIAAVSCSDYRAGWFHAYRNLAERDDLALILHLGDYFYETGGGPEDRTHQPDAEIWRLQDYRARYAQYRMDADLQRAHQVHPFATIWDDHDIVVDALRDTSLRHDAAFGAYRDRKGAAVRAAMEWLPIREFPDDSLRIWRSFRYGDLAELFLLDTRLYDRDRFAVDAADPLYGDPDHRLLGPVQMDWLLDGLSASPARWKVLANQVMMGHLQALEDEPLIFENWGGYTAERDRLFGALLDGPIAGTVVLTGDFHVSMALELALDPRDPDLYDPATSAGAAGAEFLVPSVTGENFDEGETFGFSNAAQASFLISLGNEHIRWSELEGHGYVLLDLDEERALAEYWHLEDVTDPANPAETPVNQWRTRHGSNRVERAPAVAEPIAGFPPAPPLDTVAAPLTEAPVLLSAGPNPFADAVTFHLLLPAEAPVAVQAFRPGGALLLDAPAVPRGAGHHLLRLEAPGWGPGLYLLRFTVGDAVLTARVLKR